MPKLLVEKGPNKGQALPLGDLSLCVIGREPVCQFVLNDSNVSRKHCELVKTFDTWKLRDLGSRNGTHLNGKRVEGEREVQIGDRIQTGEILISFLDDREEKDRGGLIGQRLGGYRIQERLGRGGMGTVYKANQIALNREVALKVLSPDLVNDGVFRSLFIAEARSAASLNHGNIVQVHDVGIENGLHFFSMEFMPNGSVQDLLQREGRLPPARALRIAMDAAAGLAYAERKGIVHRDIKPENLMISESGTVKIGDLGLALNVEKGDIDDQVGMMGTPHYCAPEQVTRGKLDHRTDIYALGASLYRMMAGKPPFTGATLKEILVRKVKEKAVPLAAATPGVPAEVGELVMQMMEKDPANRPQSAEEVRGRIEAILPGLDGGMLPAGGTRPASSQGSSATLGVAAGPVPPAALPVPQRPGPAQSGRPAATATWLAVSSLLLAGAIGGFGWLYMSDRSAAKKAGPPSGTTPEGGGNGSGPAVPDPAHAALDEFTRWETANAARLQTSDGINEALLKLERLREAFPNSPVAASAATRGDEYRRRLILAAGEAVLEEVNRQWALALAAFPEDRDLTILESALEAYEGVRRRYPELARQVSMRVEENGRLLNRYRTSAEDWAVTSIESERRRSTERFAEAAKLLEEAARRLEGPWKPLAEGALTSLREAEKTWWERASGQRIPMLLGVRGWDDARAVLIKARELLSPDYHGRIDALLKRVDELAAQSETTPPPPSGPTDAEIVGAAGAEAEELARGWRFEDGARLCRESFGRLKDVANGDGLRQLADDLEAIEIFKRSLRARINGGDGAGTGLGARAFRLSRAVSANENGIRLADGRDVPWETVTAVEAFRLAFNGWEVSSREAVGVGLLCLRAQSWRTARFAFGWAGARDSDAARFARALADRSDREERSWIPADPVSKKLLEVAREEKSEADLSADLIVKAYSKSKDYVAQGEVLSGLQLFEQSNEYLRTALQDKSLDRKDEWRAHYFLMMNGIMSGDGEAYRRHSYQARTLIPDTDFSRWIKMADQTWLEIPDRIADVDELRTAFLARPTPEACRLLLKLYSQKVHLLLELRIAARWMCEQWPNDGDSRSGEPLRLWAQAAFDQKDFFNAKKLFERLKRNHGKHELCRPRENLRPKVDDIVVDCTDRIKRYSLGIRPENR